MFMRGFSVRLEAGLWVRCSQHFPFLEKLSGDTGWFFAIKLF
jgi:hypothetical protein